MQTEQFAPSNEYQRPVISRDSNNKTPLFSCLPVLKSTSCPHPHPTCSLNLIGATLEIAPLAHLHITGPGTGTSPPCGPPKVSPGGGGGVPFVSLSKNFVNSLSSSHGLFPNNRIISSLPSTSFLSNSSATSSTSFFFSVRRSRHCLYASSTILLTSWSIFRAVSSENGLCSFRSSSSK